MDPVGPWYSPYNRLAVQAAAGEHSLAAAAAAAAAVASATTTASTASASPATVLPGGFLSPSVAGYETVFTPLFHNAVAASGAKPHYVAQVTQHRALAAQAAASKQTGESGEFHPQTQAFFEQGATAWQQSSPFGILPHESVVSTASKSVSYENINAHFAAAQQSINHINSQLVANSKETANRSHSPQVTTATVKAPQGNSNLFFQVPVTLAEGAASKIFTSTNTSNLQQTCIVSSPATTKEYRVPQVPNRSSFLSSPNPTARPIEKSFTSPPTKQQTTPQIQTKAQTKIYSELGNQREQQQQRTNEEPQSQSSPISFSIMDVPGRVNYTGSNASGKRPPHFQHNYRHYQQQQQQQAASQNTNSEEFQRPKSGPDYQNSPNGADCNVAIPRRPSPLQAHSQASPIGHAQSPVYPMYNSPMNSMSSPQQNSNNQQVTPPSPLDVSVPRPNSQSGGNVAYPSVITRALNTDKSFQERYDHGQTNQAAQNCWDDRQNQHQRKFQSNQANTQTQYNNSNATIEISTRQPDNQRQQYFDSNNTHQVTLQDLSSCRGDPMSIVKNLQQQQSCQIPQQEIKQEVPKPPIKRRKSADKGGTTDARVPPPAHSTTINQAPQQNGTFFEFDRWNIAPPSSKIFGTQAVLHQQHQGLMVPHPHGHPPPPIPYFTPFHIANHPSEFSSGVELTPLANYNDQAGGQQQHATVQQQQQHQHHHLTHQQHQQQQHHQQQQQQQYQETEDHPKVVVPNIEEELKFLSGGSGADSNLRPPAINHNNMHVKPQISVPAKPLGMDKISESNVGFMGSYLKFLQGERHNSPPPVMRGGPGRKQSASQWTRRPTEEAGNKPVQGVNPPATNGAIVGGAVLPNLTGPPPGITKLSTGVDPQDDPRYFPLPRERKKNDFNSSDDDMSSDDDFFGPRKSIPKSIDSFRDRSQRNRPSRPSKPVLPVEKRRQRTEKDRIQKEDIPKREQTKRAAKGKTNLSDLIKDENDQEEPLEFQDSEDSDPAWTPSAGVADEDILPVKKKGRGNRSVGTKNKKSMKNLIAAAAQGAGINDSDGYNPYPMEFHNKKKLPSFKNKQTPFTLEDNIAASMQSSFSSSTNDDNPFKTGEFLAIKSELSQEWPPLWRVDGKTLLQRYEPFEQNGTTLYRNISTYTSWTSESKKQYVSVPVKCKSQSTMEVIVEFLKNEMTIIDPKMQEYYMKESEKYQDSFEVYIQTLISQSLDSNFLMEIFQEKDEYFLTNVQRIDEVTENKKQKLLSLLKWPTNLQSAVCTWPCINVIHDLNTADSLSAKNCAACGKNNIVVRVIMYGQPYNVTTLEGCQPDTNAIDEKGFLLCRICASRVEMTSKVTHQKYLMYIECAKRVSEKRVLDPTKDTTCILNELLADESWLSQLFTEVRTLWSEIECITRNFKPRNICTQ